VLCGSATKLIGIDRLAQFLVDEAPAPTVGDGPAGAVVFKTIVDSYVGHVNFFKVLQGTIKHDDVLANGRTKGDERMHQLFVMRGKEQDTVTEVAAGDIAAVAKLSDTSTGDVLATKGARSRVESTDLPEPVLAVAIKARSKGDEDKLANALHRLQEEDLVLHIERNPETHQTVLRGMGETHLSIALEKLARKFGVEVDTEDVRVAYRETISGTAEAEGKLKKQTGGHGQFAVAWLRVEPKERGSGNEFVDAIVGGVIPKNFLPAVEKGVAEAEEQGGALGFPVVDVKITCFDGSITPSTARRWRSRPRRRWACAKRSRRRARSCSSRSASSSWSSRRRTRATSWATSTGSGAASRARRRSVAARSRSRPTCRRRRSSATPSTSAR